MIKDHRKKLLFSLHIHKDYFRGSVSGDIAVAVLKDKVDWKAYENIRPACFPSQDIQNEEFVPSAANVDQQ